MTTAPAPVPVFPEGVSVRSNEPLARHTAWRTGGCSDLFVTVHRRESLGPTLALLKELGMSWSVLGAGTRTVVRDGGIKGAVIRLGSGFFDIQRQEEGAWSVGAAVPVPCLVAVLAAAGQSGLESKVCTPGSVAAMVLLDDSPDASWEPLVASVQYLSRRRIQTGSLSQARKGKKIITSVCFRLQTGDPKSCRNRVREHLAEAGRSVGPSSWYMPLEKKNLRDVLSHSAVLDVRLRSVAVPSAAPELLVNLGAGTAHDLSLLQRSVIDRIQRFRGIELSSCIRWAGRHGESK